MSMQNYRCEKKSATAAEILIYDEIGQSWFGGVTAEQVIRDLKALGDVKDITVRINSPGGSVFDAFAMYNALVQHKAQIRTQVEGMALSAASLVAMAGNTIAMGESAWMMIHDPWTVAAGNAREQAVIAGLTHRFGHASAERALSGPGLVNLHRALVHIDRPDAGALQTNAPL